MSDQVRAGRRGGRGWCLDHSIYACVLHWRSVVWQPLVRCLLRLNIPTVYGTTVVFETVTAVIDSDTSLPAPAELAYIIRLSRNSPHSSLSLCASLFSQCHKVLWHCGGFVRDASTTTQWVRRVMQRRDVLRHNAVLMVWLLSF